MFNDQGLGVAVLIGKRDEIQQLASANNVSLEKVAIVDPETSSEMLRFLKIAAVLERYKGMPKGDLRNLLITPNYFACMMLQYGLVDGLVGGVGSHALPPPVAAYQAPALRTGCFQRDDYGNSEARVR